MLKGQNRKSCQLLSRVSSFILLPWQRLFPNVFQEESKGFMMKWRETWCSLSLENVICVVEKLQSRFVRSLYCWRPPPIPISAWSSLLNAPTDKSCFQHCRGSSEVENPRFTWLEHRFSQPPPPSIATGMLSSMQDSFSLLKRLLCLFNLILVFFSAHSTVFDDDDEKEDEEGRKKILPKLGLDVYSDLKTQF